MLNTFFENKHVHYGVTEADGSPVYGTELNFWYQNLRVGATGIFALQNEWTEWDFNASYRIDLGPVFLVPGYNFRFNPEGGDSGNGDGHDHAHHDHAHHDHDGHHAEGSHGGESHSHSKYGHELFIVAGTEAIPYVTPSVGFLWDLYQEGGGFMEIRLDGDVPLYKQVVRLEPYASLGLNFGYNTWDYYGWNNFLYGANVGVSLGKVVTVYGGVGQNVPLRAAQIVGTTPEVVATAGVSFQF